MSGQTTGSARWPADRMTTKRQIPLILMYHTVSETDDDPHQLSVSPRRFAEQMSWLARSGLRGVSVAELGEAIRAGTAKNAVGITFDDGYQSVLTSALPVLRQHGFGATVFVISERIGGVNDWDAGPVWPLLTESGVAELASAGIEIGSHSATHVKMAGIEADQLAAETAGSRASLAEMTGKDIAGFAYPYGSLDEAAKEAVRAAGYSYACAVRTPRQGVGSMALPRMYVGERDGAARMFAKRLLYRSHVAVRGSS
jgi:peptidoglycan/xylan/chitin deacetylase (PgdA/CDA1 family)